jgi:hypothetical protein
MSVATFTIPATALVPLNTVLPVISGTPQAGQTLTMTNGTWVNNPTSFTYQWNRSGSAIPGAVGPTYLLTTADVGHALIGSVTGINSFGPSLPARVTTAFITAAPAVPANTAVPTIS